MYDVRFINNVRVAREFGEAEATRNWKAVRDVGSKVAGRWRRNATRWQAEPAYVRCMMYDLESERAARDFFGS